MSPIPRELAPPTEKMVSLWISATRSSLLKFCIFSGIGDFPTVRFGNSEELRVSYVLRNADFKLISEVGGGSWTACPEPFVWFAAPKKRTSHSKKLLRMTHKWLKPVHHYTFCNHCGNPKLLHVLCGVCFKETMNKTAEYRKSLWKDR